MIIKIEKRVKKGLFYGKERRVVNTMEIVSTSGFERL
jgi:hypothetical protein